VRRPFGRSGIAPKPQQERDDRRTGIPADGVALHAGAGGLIVVGSSNYQGAITRAVGAMGPKGVSMTAALVPEPANPYDPNAVSVRVDGQVIGHLRRSDAKAYRPVMEGLAQGGLTGYCRVDIRTDPNPQYAFSVHVFIDTPQRQLDLLARGVPPTGVNS
jgi:HIRAN domain